MLVNKKLFLKNVHHLAIKVSLIDHSVFPTLTSNYAKNAWTCKQNYYSYKFRLFKWWYDSKQKTILWSIDTCTGTGACCLNVNKLNQIKENKTIFSVTYLYSKAMNVGFRKTVIWFMCFKRVWIDSF